MSDLTNLDTFRKRISSIMKDNAEKRAVEIVNSIKRGICDSETLEKRGCQCGDC